MAARAFVAVIGHEPDLEREEGAASVLRSLGADVRCSDFWDDPRALFGATDDPRSSARALLFEGLDRPDLAARALRVYRREPRLEGVSALLAVTTSQITRVEPSSGFDDFVLSPYVPAELYARIRFLEWQKSEFSTEERVKIGDVVLDRAAHEVTALGAAVSLTAKEFALLAYLCDRRGKLVSRDELLAKVWGARYEGGARTVDIHVRRLRAKLGAALPLGTLRGAGYRLDAPGATSLEPSELDPPLKPIRASGRELHALTRRIGAGRGGGG
ncbi:MAG TPA: response regulator transcription factor [Byssovorax sp.]